MEQMKTYGGWEVLSILRSDHTKLAVMVGYPEWYYYEEDGVLMVHLEDGQSMIAHCTLYHFFRNKYYLIDKEDYPKFLEEWVNLNTEEDIKGHGTDEGI